jgi:hypothetical protein
MSQPRLTPVPAAAPAPIASAAEAAQLIARLAGVMDSLLEVLTEETELVRAGRLSEIGRLEPHKAELARRYLAESAALKANGVFVARELPQDFDGLRQRHEEFRALLQINLAVLATAHAVSEGIIRGVAGEMARKSTLQTYGAGGRTATNGASAPIALSRKL